MTPEGFYTPAFAKSTVPASAGKPGLESGAASE